MISLSIIISYFNEGIYLKELLETLPDSNKVEVIIVNDNPDENIEIEGVEVVNERKSIGAGNSRNIGIKKATGKYIMFVDSDDLLEKKTLENYLYLLDQKDKDCFIFKPAAFLNNTNKRSKRVDKYRKIVNNYSGIRSDLYKFYPAWSKIYKLNFLVKNCIEFEEIRFSNDVIFSLRVFKKMNKYLGVNKQIYLVRERSNSLTRKITSESVRVRLEVINRYNNFMIGEDIGRRISYFSLFPQLIKCKFNKSLFLLIIEILNYEFKNIRLKYLKKEPWVHKKSKKKSFDRVWQMDSFITKGYI